MIWADKVNYSDADNAIFPIPSIRADTGYPTACGGLVLPEVEA